jgi:hypothetical protein
MHGHAPRRQIYVLNHLRNSRQQDFATLAVHDIDIIGASDQNFAQLA